MTPFEREVASQRKRLLQVERNGASELLRTYLAVHRRLNRQLDSLTKRIATARDAGVEVSVAWLEREERYRVLLSDLERETRAYATQAEVVIVRGQGQAATLAGNGARPLIAAAVGHPPKGGRATVETSFRRLPAAALKRMVGNASDGKPLGNLLREIAPGAVRRVRDELAFGVARGRGPRDIARDLRRVTGQATVDRVLNISRTEVLRVYRETSIESYAANDNVVKSWIWTANLDDRTCAACYAMHGTEHRFDEGLDGHPGCRCTPVPKTKSWAELGFGFPGADRSPTIEPGIEVFARASEADKLAVLGRAKLDAYNAGEITLTDLIARPRSARWGTMRREASLREAL